MKKLYFYSLTFFFLSSCNSIIKTVYDDTSARYNAYFLANEEIESIESDYKNNINKSYDSLINLTYKIDTNSISGIKDRTEGSIKKLSILIQRQSTSKYVYPSYALIGKSRLLNLDIKESITTLKYVNSKSNNKEANTMALVYLLRAYTENKDYKSAIEVDKFLRDQEMDEAIKIEYYKNSYHLYKILEEEDRLLIILKELDKLNLKKELANKVYFAIGQIYYSRNNLTLSKEYFKKCLKNNPNINMGFFAKIFIAKTNDISNESQTLKEFQKLLRDKKNIEYIDRIYFELAKYYLKNKRYDDAIENFITAISENSNDKEILFNSYLEIAKIFYEEKNDYEKSQKYYDSAITYINRENKFYEPIKERSEVLNNLVKNLNVILKNDSLIELTKLSEEDLNKLINEKINEESKKSKKQNRSISQGSFSSQEPSVIKINSADGSWYFDNPMLISSGIAEFQRIWGKRDLVDNWRLISKMSFDSEIDDIDINEIETQVGNEEKLKDDFNSIDEMKLSLPFEDEDKNVLLKEIEEAYYAIGKIYIQKLNEIKKGVEIYNNFLELFNTSNYLPEIYYQLYLIEEDNEKYKERILTDYPDTEYYKLIINPNYKIDEFQELNFLKKKYNELYKNLIEGNNQIVISMVDSLKNFYDENPFFENLSLLKIIGLGNKSGNFSLQFELKKFLKKASNESSISYASTLLKSAEEVHERFIYSGLPKFENNNDNRYYYFIKTNNNKDKISLVLNELIKKANISVDIYSFNLNNENHFDILTYESLEILKKLEKDFNIILNEEELNGNTNFVVGEKNMNLIFKSKNYTEFSKFYK